MGRPWVTPGEQVSAARGRPMVNSAIPYLWVSCVSLMGLQSVMLPADMHIRHPIGDLWCRVLDHESRVGLPCVAHRSSTGYAAGPSIYHAYVMDVFPKESQTKKSTTPSRCNA